MTKRQKRTQFVSPILVRIIGSLLLIGGALLLMLAIAYHSAFGTGYAIVIGFAGFTASSLALAAIKTGDPIWILLDLFTPW